MTDKPNLLDLSATAKEIIALLSAHCLSVISGISAAGLEAEAHFSLF